jgi:RsiW-degrading membrane proteinase PrsW (M82 family)
LPPLWAVVGGFVLALAIGWGLQQTRLLGELFSPLFIILAAALPSLAAVVWAVDGRPGWLTWRRASVAFSAGATVSTTLAILLEILVPYTILWLLLDLGEPLRQALGGLVTALAGGAVAQALTSPGFLLALAELALVAPLVEEICKSLVVLPLLKGLDSGRDVFLLGVAAGAGFAALENVIYALVGGRYWGGVLAVRALGAAVHPLCTGLMALGWHALLRREAGAGRRWVGGFGAAVGLHALWNGGIVLWLALAGTRFFGPHQWETDVLGVGIEVGLAALLALEGIGLWVIVRALARRLDGGAPALAVERLPTERAMALWAVVCLLALLPIGLVVVRALGFP